MTFAVGDRVECHYPSGEWDGELGTIVCVRDSSIGVELDNFDVCKHTCYGYTRNGHGWWYRPEYLKLVSDEHVLFDVEDLI